MRKLGILSVGVLSLAAVLALTTVVIAAAPYIAAVVLVTGAVWYALSEDEPPK